MLLLFVIVLVNLCSHPAWSKIPCHFAIMQILVPSWAISWAWTWDNRTEWDSHSLVTLAMISETLLLHLLCHSFSLAWKVAWLRPLLMSSLQCAVERHQRNRKKIHWWALSAFATICLESKCDFFGLWYTTFLTLLKHVQIIRNQCVFRSSLAWSRVWGP